MPSYLDTIPQPWTRSDIETAIFKGFNDAKIAIQETEGGKQWQALKGLEDSIWIFHYSITELLDEICVFGERSKNIAFWDDVNSDQVSNYTLAIKRKIFNCTSALMALVEHARNFQRKIPVKDFSARLSKEFSTPGLHKFLQDFRNYNTHWRIAQANWLINHSFESNAQKAHFQIKKNELLAWDKWSREAKEFIEYAPNESIDVYELFASYRTHVQNFYDWHKGAVLDEYANTIRDYLEYMRLYNGILKKYNWNLIISHAPISLNPYQYIGRYLSQSQIELLLTFPHRSEEQIDKLIQMLGMEEFCDSSLRQKIMNLFTRKVAED